MSVWLEHEPPLMVSREITVITNSVHCEPNLTRHKSTVIFITKLLILQLQKYTATENIELVYYVVAVRIFISFRCNCKW